MAETPQEYRKRILGNLAQDDPLKAQAAAPKKLERLLKGVSTAKMRKRPAADKWSIAEILAHLVDAEMVAGYRMRMTLGAPGTQIQAFNQDDWVSSGHYAQRDPRKSVAQYRALRDANLELLKLLTPAQWKQYGVHAERGEESIEMIVRMIAGHDINHLKQIEKIVSGMKL